MFTDTKYVQRKMFLFSDVIHLIKIILITPTTHAILERRFSELKRAKTLILSTMTDNRLNHLFMTHICNEELDEIQFIKVRKSSIGDVV